jgi:cell division protease FtsH
MSEPARRDLPAPSPDGPTDQFASRPKDSERTTRRPMVLWDRLKLIILFLVAWVVLVWSTYAQFSGQIPLADAINLTARRYWWLLALAVLEALRQVHYLISERSASYYRFWNKGVFGAYERRTSRMDEWTRFRVARVVKLLFFLVILDLVIAQLFGLPPATALFQLPVLIVQGLPFIFQLAFGFFFVIIQFVGLFWFLSRGGIDTYMPEDIETRFSDVKGQDAVLERVKENMIFLDDPESIEERGGYVPGGILLWGPPGTGKTLMAQSVAGETAKPFVFVDPGAFINMFMGVGILKVKGLYRKLRKLAVRYGGVIVFFDEADSLGSRGATGGAGGGGGGGWSHETIPSPWTTAPSCNGIGYLSPAARSAVLMDALSGGDPPSGGPVERIFMGGMAAGGGGGTLQALLSEMSGLEKPRGFFNRYIRRLLGMKPKPPPKYRILHMFATNMPQSLDEAMLRPGRVDRLYKVGYPHKEGRKATFQYYLKRVKNELNDEHVDKLATISPYATGASIKDMVNEGLIIAIRDGRESISWADIIKAKQLKEHGLPDDHEYIERERHSVAVHEACHAVVAYRLRRHAVIDMATIERRGDVGGFVSSIPPEDQFVEWRSERDIDVMTFLASLAGERLFYDGDNSAGVGGDMRGATSIATIMEGYTAMGETIASHAVSKVALTRGRGMGAMEDGTDRNFLETELGRRVETKLQNLYRRTWKLLEDNRAEVLAVAHALESHRTVTGDDVAAVIEGRQGPLVDGRPYHDPAFIARLEAYHRAALEAHKDHSNVDVSLPEPVLVGVAAVEAESGIGLGGNGDGVHGNGGASLPPRPDER